MDTLDGKDYTSAEFYAAFSQAVYKEDTEAMMGALEHQGITGWDRDEDLSHVDRSVFYRKKRDQESGEDIDGHDVIFSNRGTSQTRNLLPDVAIAFGAEGTTKRYKDLKNDYVRTKEKYGSSKDNIVSTGHSLGGNMSTFINRTYGTESHSYNPGASLSHIKKGVIHKIACWANPKYNNCEAADSSHIYHVAGDPLSTASLFDRDHKHLFKVKKGWHVHTIDNFLKNPQKL